MSHYATITIAPRTLTQREQAQLLKTTGQHKSGFRDHVLFSVALATGLREHEVVALNVGDVFDPSDRPRRRVVLRVYKRSNTDARMQEVMLPDRLRLKLEKYAAWKRAAGQSMDPDAPLFMSQKHARLSTRQVRTLMQLWQKRAGLERPLGYHGLRHSACTNLYAATKDIRLTQRFARHKSLSSTVRYTHASDDELMRAVGDLPC